MKQSIIVILCLAVSNILSLKKRQGKGCEATQCCKTNIDGVSAEFCPTEDKNIFAIMNYPAQVVVPRLGVPGIKYYRDVVEKSNKFTLRVLVMNAWGFNVWAEDKQTRMPAIAAFLKQSNHDIVFIQEVWYHSDFQKLRDTFPYSTFYGSPGSLLCPAVSNDQSFYLQLLPVDCHGMMILSKHKILDNNHIFFQDRIPELEERFARRGAFAATLEVEKSVAGVNKSVKICAINTHLATWYSETEELWTRVRESQAEEVMSMVAEHKNKADIVVLAGDLNSTPGSPVYKKLISAGMTDSLVNLKGNKSTDTKFATYGHADNTWTAEEHTDRIDYVLYTTNNKVTARTSAYRTVSAKTEKEGEMISLSDHMWVEAFIRINIEE